jgi:hypothetical protein
LDSFPNVRSKRLKQFKVDAEGDDLRRPLVVSYVYIAMPESAFQREQRKGRFELKA